MVPIILASHIASAKGARAAATRDFLINAPCRQVFLTPPPIHWPLTLFPAPFAHEATMSIRYLDKIFKPASVALIGASAREHSLGAITLANLLGGGFQGEVWP